MSVRMDEEEYQQALHVYYFMPLSFSGSQTGSLLLETGDTLLLETGDKLLLG